MGKIRSKRIRERLTGSGSTGILPCSGDEKRASVLKETLSAETRALETLEMLVPLPETIMSCQPVLPLNDVAGGKQASQRPTQKKDRRKLRHQQWIQKLEGYKKAREVSEAAQRRSQAEVVGDLQPLVAALPAIDLHERPRDTVDTKKCANRKHRGKQMLQQQSSVSNPSMLSEVDHFQRVLKHTAFQEDPLSAITEHINNSLAKHIL